MTLEPLHSDFPPELIKQLTVPHKKSSMLRIYLASNNYLKQLSVSIHIPRSGIKTSKGALVVLDSDLS